MNLLKQKEEKVVMDIPGFNSVRRLLGMKGIKRLEVNNTLTDKILNFNYSEETPGVRLKFLETRRNELEEGGWVNYNILFEVDKYKDTPEYLKHVFSSISKIIGTWESETGLIDVMGIQEVDSGKAGFYYVLIYMLGDGQDKKLENYEEKEQY